MRALLLGSAGMLARDLVAEAPAGVELIAKTRAELDITDADAVESAIMEAEPQVIINCAAYTDVDGAESEPEQASAVNGDGPGIVGSAAGRVTSRVSRITPFVVHFSTDYVFNGRGERPYREDEPPDPLGVYGASKLAGEEALVKSGANYLIVRTSWLFGLHGKSFPRTMWERAQARKPTRVVNDQVGRPTYTVDLARAVWGLITAGREDGRTGGTAEEQANSAQRTARILHIANTGTATWYDMAERIFARAGKENLLSSCTTAEYPTPAQRPRYSVLDTNRFETLTGQPLPRWRDALDRFLEEI